MILRQRACSSACCSSPMAVPASTQPHHAGAADMLVNRARHPRAPSIPRPDKRDHAKTRPPYGGGQPTSSVMRYWSGLERHTGRRGYGVLEDVAALSIQFRSWCLVLPDGCGLVPTPPCARGRWPESGGEVRKTVTGEDIFIRSAPGFIEPCLPTPSQQVPTAPAGSTKSNMTAIG